MKPIHALAAVLVLSVGASGVPAQTISLDPVITLAVGSNPQAIVATQGRVFVSDKTDRTTWAFTVGSWQAAWSNPQTTFGGNEGGAAIGDIVYFPDIYVQGATRITRLARIDAVTLGVSFIPLNFTAGSYACAFSGETSTNTDLALSAGDNRAWVQWGRDIAVVDLASNSQIDVWVLPRAGDPFPAAPDFACSDEIEFAAGKLYTSVFASGSPDDRSLFILNASTGFLGGDGGPFYQAAGLDRSADGTRLYFNRFFDSSVGQLIVANDTPGLTVDNELGGAATSFDLAADTVAGSPFVFAALTTDSNPLNGGRLEALNMSAGTVVNRASFGAGVLTPYAVAVDPAGRYVYVAGPGSPSGRLSVLRIRASADVIFADGFD